jgi:hypothetical protein
MGPECNSADDTFASHGVGSSRTQAGKRKATDTPPPLKNPRKKVWNRSSGINIDKSASNPSSTPTPLKSIKGRYYISTDPTGRLNWNLPLCWVLFFYFPRCIGTRVIFFQTPLRRILSQVTRPQRMRKTRLCVEPKVQPTCQKLQAPTMLHPRQPIWARVIWRIHRVLNRLSMSPPRLLHQTTLLMESELLVKILLVATLLSLRPKVFLG